MPAGLTAPGVLHRRGIKLNGTLTLARRPAPPMTSRTNFDAPVLRWRFANREARGCDRRRTMPRCEPGSVGVAAETRARYKREDPKVLPFVFRLLLLSAPVPESHERAIVTDACIGRRVLSPHLPSDRVREILDMRSVRKGTAQPSPKIKFVTPRGTHSADHRPAWAGRRA